MPNPQQPVTPETPQGASAPQDAAQDTTHVAVDVASATPVSQAAADEEEVVLFKNVTQYTEEFLLRSSKADQTNNYKIQSSLAVLTFAIGAGVAFYGKGIWSFLFGVLFLALAIFALYAFLSEPKRRAHSIYQGFLHDFAQEITATTTITTEEVYLSYDDTNVASSFPVRTFLDLKKGDNVYVLSSATGLTVPLDKNGFTLGTPAEFEAFVQENLRA